MLESQDIYRLYENVLKNDMELYNISLEDVQFGIECMAHVYGEKTGLSAKRSIIADFFDPAHRCAYLHKYAALHTAMVCDMLKEAVKKDLNFFKKLIDSNELFKICSLGSGPGTDVIGTLAALQATFGDFDASVTLIDYMQEWSSSFDSILKELGNGEYGTFGKNMSYNLRWQYVRANLLKTPESEVLEALTSANLVTMIKFISAAACKDTRAMIRNIFTVMKEGASLLFIDNDGGGFHNLIEDAAIEFGFESKFGPLRREIYRNNLLKKRRFGYRSCFETIVAVHILQKPFVGPCHHLLSSHEAMHRQVIINNNFTSTKPSSAFPVSPSLHLGHPDENCSNFMRRIPSLLVSITPSSSAMSQTSSCQEYRPDENGNCIDCASTHEMEESAHPSARTVIIPSCSVTPNTSHISSPHRDNLRRRVNYIPYTQHRSNRARTGCLPFRVKRFRHHLSNRFNQFKAQIHSNLKKMKKKKTQRYF